MHHRQLLSALVQRTALFGLAGLALWLPLGCTSRSDPGAVGGPTFGAAVPRFETNFFSTSFDPETGLTALIGVSPAELPDACQGATPSDLSQVLAVFHPSPGGGTVIKATFKDGEQNVIVWAAQVQNNLCDELLNVQPIATGTVRTIYTDSDFFNSGPGGEAIGVDAKGTVTSTTSAQQYRIQLSTHVTILPDGTVRRAPPVVRLTRVGG
jgi:hypothetical protein